MLIYFVLFFLITVFCLFDIENKADEILVFSSLCVLLIVICGLRPAESSTDYINYELFFKEIKPGITFFIPGTNSEPFYNFIPAFLKLLGVNVMFSFLVYSFIGVSLKGVAIVKSTGLIFLSLLIYYSNFFFLHEWTQIRIGAAIGIYLISFPFILKKNIVVFSLLMVLATCFHFSAILLWLTYFINCESLNKKRYLIAIAVILPLTVLKLDLLSFVKLLPLGVFVEKIDFYYGAMESGAFGSEINVFNVITILNIILCFIFIWKIELLQVNFKYAVLFVKMYISSLIIFLLFSFIPPLAFRFRELFEVVQIMLIPQLVFIFREKFIGKLIVILIAFLLFYINIVHSTHIVNAYF